MCGLRPAREAGTAAAGPLPRRNSLTPAVWWGSLLLALALLVLVYRPALPPGCIRLLHDAAGVPVTLPLARFARDTGREVISLRHRFDAAAGAPQRPALYLGEAAPYYRLEVNGRDLTPGTDLAQARRRDLAPQLHALPRDLLRVRGNELLLQVPLDRRLSETRVDTLCLGDYSLLAALHSANWWRRSGTPRVALCLYALLAGIVFALRGVYRNAPLYRWYLACLALMALRCSYLAGGDMPGAPEYWRAASDSSVVLLVYAIYRLLTTLWQIREPRRHEAALLLTAALQVAALWSGWTLALPAANLLLWISVCAGAGWMMARIAARASHVPAVEKHLLHWAMLFAVVSGMLEAATYRLDPAWRLIWLYPVGTATLALAFGFLLTRRALLGGRLLAHARQSLGRDLDLTLLACADRADAVWDSLSTRVASQERERVLLDIGAGFGARMARIAQELRRLQPQSRLPLDIHRALLDLRLMIDATDLDLTSADDAFVLLRRHLDPALAAAGISAHWDLSALRELRLGDRRRLMELFRCLEELLSNVMQHSAARQVAVTCGFAGGWLRVAVTDNGRGLPEGATQGRGLANVAARLRALDGEAAFSTPPLHPGTQVEIAVPWR
ncbi:sensor histidine kinase [Tahibacter harae]|uniref:histidine kinase n=1 Tax=Tahibacter harae TaxID=2963937 RepID=A0ABT1QTC0_9GAMM|nr:sensor histidine kinase [Tahibacter harae]MCQ4165516.1 hypothetical protein [Tahibacter harae]